MARKPIRRTNANLNRPVGETVKDILGKDIKELKADDQRLRRYVQKLADAGNKRLKRFEKLGEESPATVGVGLTGGRFSTKGLKTQKELLSEYRRLKDFFDAETSSVRTWRKVKAQTIETIEKNAGFVLDDDSWSKTWKAYESLKEVNPKIANKAFKYFLLELINQMAQDKETSADKIAEMFSEKDEEGNTKLDKLYEKIMSNQEIVPKDEKGTSQYFDGDDEDDS